jgi:hypothetical protein
MNHYEGISIEFTEDFTLSISANKKLLSFETKDIKTITCFGEVKTCDCCEGIIEEASVSPKDLFLYKAEGGLAEIESLRNLKMRAEEKIRKLEFELRKKTSVLEEVLTYKKDKENHEGN